MKRIAMTCLLCLLAWNPIQSSAQPKDWIFQESILRPFAPETNYMSLNGFWRHIYRHGFNATQSTEGVLRYNGFYVARDLSFPWLLDCYEFSPDGTAVSFKVLIETPEKFTLGEVTPVSEVKTLFDAAKQQIRSKTIYVSNSKYVVDGSTVRFAKQTGPFRFTSGTIRKGRLTEQIDFVGKIRSATIELYFVSIADEIYYAEYVFVEHP